MKGIVSNIQRFSTADGPGIRTTVFLKGCGMRCKWCHNPETFISRPQTLDYRKNGVNRVENCGREMSAEEVFGIIAKDEVFYSESGGGATLSGGEPLLQSVFCAELLKLIKARGINTIVDTAGAVPFSAFEAVLPYTDEFYYDYKLKDAEDYMRYTGGDYGLIVENLKELVGRGASVTARIPLIPGVNDGDDYQFEMADFLRSAGVAKANVLPYHKLGTGKYKALDMAYPMEGTELPSKERLESTINIYKRLGFDTDKK